MWRKIQFALLFLLLLLASLSIATQSGFAQSVDGPLNFGNNFFVTGDYVVAGAYGLHAGEDNGYARGIIAVPDLNPGIQPGVTSTCVISGITFKNCVPAGAQIVAALLYWQTIESSAQIGSGQNGFFRPLYKGGPQTGYPISGVNLTGQSTVSFGGCTDDSGGSGKVVQTYRADVRAYLPQDSSGDVSANGAYEVRLPSNEEGTPRTRGATLVIIYRILSPNVPLNSIVIYDGAFAIGNNSSTMKQTVQGFYEATPGVSRLTHIVGGGHSEDNYQTVSLDKVQLPSLYGSGHPPFPGWYGGWDNPTWTFGNPKVPAIPNPLKEDDASATTQVVRTSSQGCVSWGAVIVSTTVQNSDNDGLLDVWKTNKGYCDASINEGVCRVKDSTDPAWVDLAAAGTPGQGQDVFVQLDYMCSKVNGPGSCDTSNLNYSFDPRLTVDPADGKNAVDKVVTAFGNNKNHTPINLHVIYTHAIQEDPCTDVPGSPPALCPFLNQPGAVGWPGGFVFFENQFVDPNTGNLCLTSTTGCMAVFQHGKKDSYHHALFAHALGLPSWTVQSGTLTSVVQSGTTVTFTTSTPHGLNSSTCGSSGRVTVAFAITNLNMNGTFCVTVTSPTTFTIPVTNSTSATYTRFTDPNLAVASGQAGTVSGFSDIGGAHSVIALGNWGADGQSWQVKAGTFMHEAGHSLGLTHGGLFLDNLQTTPNDYTPSVEPNCKPNHQSVMNYLFQVDLLDNGTVGNVPDYSGQALSTLSEGSPTSSPISNATYLSTSWYLPTVLGTSATQHCDGTPLLITDKPMSRVVGLTNSLSWLAGQDINFDGNSTESMRGHDDWMGTPTMPGIDLRQISATGTLSAPGLGGRLGGGGGLGGRLGGGGGVGGLLDGAGGLAGKLGGGGGLAGKLGGGGGLGGRLGGGGGVGELNRSTANSVTRPPRNLMASEEASARFIDLSWTTPTFGQIIKYKVYRSEAQGSFNLIATVTGNPPATTYKDTVSCDSNGFRYFVTAVISVPGVEGSVEQESVPSNIAPSSGPLLTGCYTNTQGMATLTDLSFPANPNVQGSLIPITWTLQVDNPSSYPPNQSPFVNNLAANTLVAIGPLQPLTAGACPTSVPPGPVISLLSKGNVINPPNSTSTYGATTGPNYKFTFTLDTDVLSSGCYFLKLTTDSGQSETTASALQLGIDIKDTDSTPHITTTSLPAGTVGLSYNTAINQDGGTAPFSWGFTGSLPPGIIASSAGTLSGTTCAAGTYPLVATVTDSKSNSGTQGLTLLINRANTTTGVSSNANPAVYGQTISFTVTVAPNSPCIPTGSVTLLSDGTPMAPKSLSGGTATFTTSLPVGTHNITATYGGDGNFIGSTSASLVQIVNKAMTTTSVTSSLNPSVFGQAVTFTAAVVPVLPGAGAPTGMVSFFDGATPIGSGTISGGTASLTTSALAVATHNITATYVGDGNFLSSTSGSFSQTVNKANTTTSVSSSLNPSVFGQAVTLTAAVVSVLPGAGAPTGSIAFLDGGTSIGSAPVSGGVAMLTTTNLPFGINTITATYGGDPDFNASNSASLSQTVKAYTTTSVISSPNPAVFGQPVTFTATASPVAPGVGAPTGMVNFFDGATSLGSGTLSGGTASLTTSALSVGFHSITSNYLGDTLFVSSASSSITVPVQAVVTNTADSGAGSLRQAILDVNAQSGPQSQPLGIVFNIPGAGVQTITPSSPLPTLTQPTILDGTTQPGYVATPIIELDGSSAGASVHGIHITAGNSTVRGLAIHSFSGDGILIDTNGGDVIQGNYIGTDVNGATAQPNSGNGIQIIATPNNVVGGTASSMRNLISGNVGEGVRIDGTLATGNTVQGNYVGTDASGSAAIGNNASGIYIRRAPGNSVIGNVVSGNIGFAGIAICGTASFCGGGDPALIDETSNAAGNVVQGNFVGTNSAGTAALGNNGYGVSIDGAPNTQVGGTTSNVISFNGTNDVQIFDTGATGNKILGNTIQGKTAANTVGISVGTSLTGNTLSQNSISGHTGLGIDLFPAGVNPNQLGGANNFPVITSAQSASGTITGTLNSTASATFTIEFFSNASCNTVGGNGEGATFLGRTSVTTDASGNASFSVSVSGFAAASVITATSTDLSGTTSEFSACVAAN